MKILWVTGSWAICAEKISGVIWTESSTNHSKSFKQRDIKHPIVRLIINQCQRTKNSRISGHQHSHLVIVSGHCNNIWGQIVNLNKNGTVRKSDPNSDLCKLLWQHWSRHINSLLENKLTSRTYLTLEPNWNMWHLLLRASGGASVGDSGGFWRNLEELS